MECACYFEPAPKIHSRLGSTLDRTRRSKRSLESVWGCWNVGKVDLNGRSSAKFSDFSLHIPEDVPTEIGDFARLSDTPQDTPDRCILRSPTSFECDAPGEAVPGISVKRCAAESADF